MSGLASLTHDLRSLPRALARFEPFIAPHRAALFAIVALGACAGLASALEPLAMKWLFDTFAALGPKQAVVKPVVFLIGLLVAVELLGSLREWLLWRVRLSLDYALMRSTVVRLHSLPLADQRDPHVGATMTQVARGIEGFLNALYDVLMQMFPAVVYLTVAALAMLRLDWQLALAVIAFAPLPAVLGGWSATARDAREVDLRERRTSVFARFNEVLTGLVAVKSVVMEEQEKRRFLSGISDANVLVLRGVSRDAATQASKNLLMIVARVLVVAVGGMLWMRGQVALGTLIAFLGYLGGVYAPVQTLSRLRSTLRTATASLEAILSVLERQDSLGDAPDARDVGPICGQVEFHHVSFMYRPERPVLRDVSLSVQPGEVVAFVGPSGGGKTTLLALLQRLYDPTSGSISIDGVDIRTLKQRSLREQIGVVLAEGALFSATVRDNIAFGKPRASQREIEAAARAANAHDFIMALPLGYDTPVGEQGELLSSSQRMRVAIARVMLKDAPILVLDEERPEPDAEVEREVQQAITRSMQGRTTFVIAHRLSTIVSADRVAVFREGTIAELGTHEELLSREGHYASYVTRQIHGSGAPAAA